MIVATDSLPASKYLGAVSVSFSRYESGRTRESVSEAFERASRELGEQAESLGADAVSGMRIESVVRSNQVFYVMYGTAVRLAD